MNHLLAPRFCIGAISCLIFECSWVFPSIGTTQQFIHIHFPVFHLLSLPRCVFDDCFLFLSLFLILVYFSWRNFITHSMAFIVLSFGMRMYSKHRHISSNEKGCSHAKRQPHYTHIYTLCKARKWTISLAITKYLERKLNLISRLFHIPNIIAIERSLCW